MIQDTVVNINIEFETCGVCGLRLNHDDTVYYPPTYNLEGLVYCSPKCYNKPKTEGGLK